MSSMSVHSLIDKFSSTGDELPSIRRPQPNSDRISRTSSSPSKSPTKPASAPPQVLSEPWSFSSKPRVPFTNPSEEDQSRQNKPEEEKMVPSAVAVSFLGPEVKDFPMSVTTFNSALLLRAEQEKTRQETIRLEIASRNLAIIEAGAKNEVPPHLVPSMCITGVDSQKPPGFPATNPMHPGFRYHKSGDMAAGYWPPSASNSAQASPFLGPSPQLATREQLDNANPVAPSNYRFGGGPNKPTGTPQHGHRRSRSPAKIGAAAVASLANPVTPYRPVQRTLPLHQRHFSMPTDPTNRYHAGIESQPPPQRGQDRLKKPLATPQSSVLQSPMGSTSSMQVRPTPALPLHKQTKSSQIPSQESMSSFQHVIQFHHWKPENPGAERSDRHEKRGSVSLQPPLPYSHKRHKSHDMSIDLSHEMLPQNTRTFNSTPQYQSKEQADVSMEVSDTAADEKPEAPKPQNQNAHRFPRDILSAADT